MKDEIVQGVFSPLKEDDWMLIKTEQNIYSLRLGGYKREEEGFRKADYKEVFSPFAGCKIKEIYSDDFWMYIVLDNGGVISSGEASINHSGETPMGVFFENASDYEDGFFESAEFFKLITGADGWSEKLNSQQ